MDGAAEGLLTHAHSFGFGSDIVNSILVQMYLILSLIFDARSVQIPILFSILDPRARPTPRAPRGTRSTRTSRGSVSKTLVAILFETVPYFYVLSGYYL